MELMLRTMLTPRWKPEAVQHVIKLRILSVPMLYTNRQSSM